MKGAGMDGKGGIFMFRGLLSLVGFWGLVWLGLMLEFGPRRECGGAPKKGFSLASAWHRSHAQGAAVGVEAGREVDVTLALWRTPKRAVLLPSYYKRLGSAQ